jgi:hypothetical protein
LPLFGGVFRLRVVDHNGVMEAVLTEPVRALEPIVLIPKKVRQASGTYTLSPALSHLPLIPNVLPCRVYLPQVWITVQAARASSTFGKIALHPLLASDDTLLLVFYIAHERLKGAKSKWSPYFRCVEAIEAHLAHHERGSSHTAQIASPGRIGMGAPDAMLDAFSFKNERGHAEGNSDSVGLADVAPSQPAAMRSRASGFIDYIGSIAPKLRKAFPSLFEPSGENKSSCGSAGDDSSLTLANTQLLLWAASVVDAAGVAIRSSASDLVAFANSTTELPDEDAIAAELAADRADSSSSSARTKRRRVVPSKASSSGRGSRAARDTPPRPGLAVVPLTVYSPSLEAGVPLPAACGQTPRGLWTISTVPAVAAHASAAATQSRGASGAGASRSVGAGSGYTGSGPLASGIAWQGTDALAKLAAQQPQALASIVVRSLADCAEGTRGMLAVDRGEGEIAVFGSSKARPALSPLRCSPYGHALARLAQGHVTPKNAADETDTLEREREVDDEADEGVTLPYSLVDSALNHVLLCPARVWR